MKFLLSAIAAGLLLAGHAEWVRAPLNAELRTLRKDLDKERVKVRALTTVTGQTKRAVEDLERKSWRLECMDDPMPCLKDGGEHGDL